MLDDDAALENDPAIKYFIQVPESVFVGSEIGGANLDEYELRFTPDKEPKVGGVLYHLVKNGSKVVVLVSKEESMILFEVVQFFDVDRLRVKPLSNDFANSWKKIF